MATSPATESKKTVYVQVQMDDDRIVEFPGKRRMLKESLFKDDGSIAVRLDFLNGETRTYTLAESLLARFAAHGAEQKLGDEIAGLDDVDDAILAIDELMSRLDSGDWTVRREANGLAGTSILARALVEATGKPASTIKTFLSTKTQAEKVALRQNPKIAAIVAKLEAAKVKKGPVVDTDALLGELA